MIKIYSKDGCPFCDRAKTVLTKHGYRYEEVRIDLDESAREWLKGEGHRSVPQLYVGETLLVENGFTGLACLTTKEIATRIREINGN